MKKLLILALALIMVLSVFVSCGKDDPEDTTEEPEETENNDPVDIPDGFTAFASPKTFYVNTTKLNVRSAPEVVDGNVVGALNYQDKVTAVAENDKWMYISYNGTPAYVSKDYLVDEKPDDTTVGTVSNETDVPDSEFSPIGDAGETVYVCPTDENDKPVNGDANYYSAPNRSKLAGVLPAGTELTRVAKTVENNDATYGWSKLTYVNPETNQSTTIYMRNSVVSTTKPVFESEQ